ncbi:non-classical arabinogalactan protein 31-like [Glycine soja]|uniref:Non-classical arabinogalactan protein 30 n=1 Tax=Glycine soja TaxID=3848 RepID=A0A445I6P8_GLYSO|nr:non-classical arabinogalactan protein 31-like [Glycine soja]RZB81585.1 Non-classical arabinogalactan protein 30 [Glycine soja]
MAKALASVLLFLLIAVSNVFAVELELETLPPSYPHPHPVHSPTPAPLHPPANAPHPHHHHHHHHPPAPAPAPVPSPSHHNYPPTPAPAKPPTHHHHHHPPAPVNPPPVPVHPPVKPPVPVHPPVKPPVPVHPPVKPPVPAHPPVKPPVVPVHPPVKPPVVPVHPFPRSFVAVQGVVYVKSCKYAGVDTLLGATPLLGAVVKLQCNNTKYKLVQTSKSDKNGYFYIEAPKSITTYGAHKCNVVLVSAPYGLKASNLHGGVTGALLRPEKPFLSKRLPFVLYTVGPLAFEPNCH